MSKNADNNSKEKNQLSNKSEEKDNYFPKIVNIRLFHRKKVTKFSIFIFISKSIYFILGIIFFVAAYVTRFFISNPDKFWEQIMKRPYLLILQKFCAGSGIYICFFSIFMIMDNVVIYILLKKGGLKRRLQYSIYILLIMEIINFCFSLYSICCFRNILLLFPIFFVQSFITLVMTVIYFLLIRRSCNVENLFLLSIERLNKYIECKQKIKNEKEN